MSVGIHPQTKEREKNKQLNGFMSQGDKGLRRDTEPLWKGSHLNSDAFPVHIFKPSPCVGSSFPSCHSTFPFSPSSPWRLPSPLYVSSSPPAYPLQIQKKIYIQRIIEANFVQWNLRKSNDEGSGFLLVCLILCAPVEIHCFPHCFFTKKIN